MQVLWLIFREASQGELAFWKHRNSRGMELKPLRFQFWVINLVFSFNRCFSSVQFSSSVVSDSLQPHESQHTRPHCPSPTPGIHWNSCPSSWWYHPAISSSVIRFSSCPQSLPASGSFPMNQLFTSGGQSIGVSALASFLPMNTQDCSVQFRTYLL